jgi:hypothetical protein
MKEVIDFAMYFFVGMGLYFMVDAFVLSLIRLIKCYKDSRNN